MHGVCALVLPVRRTDGARAVLKLQQVDDETAGEPLALRAWTGRGAVRLLAHDAPTGTMLLERLDAARPLTGLARADSRAAVRVVAELLARLTAVPAPPGVRRLADVARELAARSGAALPGVADPDLRRVLGSCAGALRELLAEGGAGGSAARSSGAAAEPLLRSEAAAEPLLRSEAAAPLLHWDLHFGNVLGAARAPWLAIDPKPLAGDPGFELYPALHNRFEADEVRWRFDAMTDALGLDRERARAWTLARVLQTCVWDVEEGRRPADRHPEIARRLLRR
jgi:streptomycin 6-kinase